MSPWLVFRVAFMWPILACAHLGWAGRPHCGRMGYERAAAGRLATSPGGPHVPQVPQGPGDRSGQRRGGICEGSVPREGRACRRSRVGRRGPARTPGQGSRDPGGGVRGRFGPGLGLPACRGRARLGCAEGPEGRGRRRTQGRAGGRGRLAQDRRRPRQAARRAAAPAGRGDQRGHHAGGRRARRGRCPRCRGRRRRQGFACGQGQEEAWPQDRRRRRACRGCCCGGGRDEARPQGRPLGDAVRRHCVELGTHSRAGEHTGCNGRGGRDRG